MSKRTPHVLRGMADAEEHDILARTLYDAADEVERLRAALRAIIDHQESIGGGLAVLSPARKIAVEALRDPLSQTGG